MTLETWQAPRSWSMSPNPHTEAQRVERFKESMFEDITKLTLHQPSS